MDLFSKKWKLKMEIEPCMPQITSIGVSQDETKIISGHGEEMGSIIIWDINSGKYIKEFEGHTSDVIYVRFLHDGTKIISSCCYNICLWEYQTGKCLQTIPISKLKIICLNVSQCEKYIISGSLDGLIRIWNITNGNLVKVFRNI